MQVCSMEFSQKIINLSEKRKEKSSAELEEIFDEIKKNIDIDAVFKECIEHRAAMRDLQICLLGPPISFKETTKRDFSIDTVVLPRREYDTLVVLREIVEKRLKEIR